MAIYYHYFDLSFLITVIVFFVVVFVSSANVILGLLLITSKKALTFTITSREAFSKPRERDCKGFFEGCYSLTNVFFKD